MFSFFKKGKPTVPFTDKVWKTREAAFKGLLMMGMMRLQKNQPCLIVAFFESEMNSLQAFMQEHKMNFILLDSSAIINTIEPMIYLANATTISDLTISKFLSESVKVFDGLVYFPGHYPLSNPENMTLEKLSSIGFTTFIFCLSFDDPLLKHFGSANILPILERLGLEDQESLEHNMITQSIKNAREKVAKKVEREIKCHSPEDWFSKNIK